MPTLVPDPAALSVTNGHGASRGVGANRLIRLPLPIVDAVAA